MKCTYTFFQRCLALFAAFCLAISIPAAYAVVKNVSIVDDQGNSLANTRVTIVFPDGTEVEEETDDDGMLVYDFPEDGDYTVNYPGGQMAVNVSGGIATWMWVAGGVAAAATAVGIYAIVDDDSDGGSSSSSSPGSSPSTCTEAASFFQISTSVVSNPGDHPTDGFGIDYEVVCSSPPDLFVQNITGSPQWNCTIDSNGTCNSAPSSCTYAGITTTCSLSSTFTENSHTSWVGTMTAGLDGNLPPGGGSGQPIEVSFTGN